MYEAYYGFQEKPFSMLPDPGFLFLSKKHQSALTMLEYGLMNHVGFCVISGEPGAGKTTILRAILENIGDDVTVGLITNTHQTFGGLLDWILSVFDLHKPGLTQVEMHQVFIDFLIDEYANKRTVLLIVDEAQNMSADSLEELRMLSNVNTEKDQLLQVVLAGQPALKDILRRPELMQFAQRIAVDYHLDPLNLEETCGYIQHRLRKAGADRDILTPRACQRIYEYSGGTPRLINLLCETVLVYGFADQKELIDADMVDEMVQERMKDSVVPIASRDRTKSDDPELLRKLEVGFPHISPATRTEPVEEKIQRDDGRTDATLAVAGTSVKAQQTDDSPGPESNKPGPDKQQADTEVTAEDKLPTGRSQPVHTASTETVRAKRGSGRSVSAGSKQASTGDMESPSAGRKAVVHKTIPDKVSDQEAGSAGTDITGQAIKPNTEKKGGGVRRQLIIFGGAAFIIGLLLIVVALSLDEEGATGGSSGQEQNRLERQATERIEAERLRAEEAEAHRLAEEQAQREAAIEAAELQEAERRAAEDAARKEAEEKDAAEQEAARLAAEQAEKEQVEKARAEEARIAEQKKLAKEKLAKDKLAKERQQALEAKYEAERARRKAEQLEQERKLKEQEETRRLEQEWLEEQLRALEQKQQSQ